VAESPSHGYRDNRLLAALPPETLASLAQKLQSVSMPAGTVLAEPGAVIDQIVFPTTGLISMLVVTKDGAAIETAMVGREGALGLHRAFGERKSFTRAETQVGGKFLTIRAASFAQIAKEHAPVRDLIGRYTEVLWAESQQLATCNAIHDASSRLCRWLLQGAERAGSEKLPLTQEFMAQMLGVRRTTVTLLAQTLQRKKLIKYSRGQITILDRRGLEAGACECYHIIQPARLPSAIGVKL